MADGRGSGRHLVLMGSVAVAVLAADQLSKSWAVERLSDGRTIDLIGSLRFNLAFNSGAAFSRGTGFGPVIAVLAVLLIAALLWTGRSATSKLSAVAVGLIVGGAVGNLTDRLLRDGPGGFLGGAVVDFVDLQWWPIFNVADSAVVVGGILLVLSAGFSGRDRDESDDAAPSGDASGDAPDPQGAPAAGDADDGHRTEPSR
ncbi:MAG: signal peptidase II [Acidimicrobiales bacterium]|nr:signal peptidase II [Acidimicrobiales bacterium]